MAASLSLRWSVGSSAISCMRSASASTSTLGDDEALFAISEEVFGAGGGGGEDGTSAGHGLALHQSQAFFDARQNEQMAGAHFLCELCLWKRAGEDYVFGGQRGE